MTTNKPGTVTQQPLFGCTSCYEDASYPADHLHVYSGECWCENCWEYATHEIADGRDWSKLEPFRPALKADYERLQAETERLRSECEKLRKDAEGMGQLLAECRAHLKPYHDSFMRAEAWEEGRYKSADALYRKIDSAMQEPNK